jgi:hypothetical protein
LNNLSKILKSKITWLCVSIILICSLILYLHPWYKTQKHIVVLKEAGFEPATISVRQGDEIIFKTTRTSPFWPASNPHPLHDLYPGFDPGKPLFPERTWIFKANKLGTWNYHDHLFPSFKGSITVLSINPLKRSDIDNLIKKFGPETAYARLKEEYRQAPITLSHNAFHLFGEVLYKSLGLPGISVCDGTFGFGCFHGLFVSAVSDKGTSVINSLDEECVNKFGPLGLGCPHGIGHGLGEFFGPQKLEEQLSICKSLNWQGPLFGCSSGVFMEHNFPTNFKESDVTELNVRQLIGSQYYEPCSTTAKEFRQSCFFEQASWWTEIFYGDYEKIGKLCNSIVNTLEKIACLEGVGNVAVESSNYDTKEAISSCAKMPSRYTEAYCRVGASWAFFANSSESESEEVCQGLGNYESLCLKKRILVGGQSQ